MKTQFTNNHPGKGWFYAFLRRHEQLSQKPGEYLNRARGEVTEKAIRDWFDEIPVLLGENTQYLNDPMCIFNMDFYMIYKIGWFSDVTKNSFINW